MKALLGATALSLVMLGAGTAPAAAEEINIHIYGDEDVKVGHGARGKSRGAHMGQRGHHRMHHNEDRRGGHHGRGYGHHGRGHDDDHHSRRADRGGRHGGKMGHGRRMDRLMDLIELYDRDGDGKVTQAEIDQGRADRLSEFDGDGNGTLSLQEYEALWLDAMRERMVDRFQKHDDNGDGEVTVEEFSERTGRLVMRGDRNDDGAIGPEDMRRGDRGRQMMRGDHGRPMMRGGRGQGMMRGEPGQGMMRGEPGEGMMRDRDEDAE